eukprot:m.142341 g.142341  ORF g.142341 m.142341 type:complete len:151 (-) comp17675_c0_seq3:357-809(-)
MGCAGSRREFPIDFVTFLPDTKSHNFVALPTNFESKAKPNVRTVVHNFPALVVLETFLQCALQQPRTKKTQQANLNTPGESEQIELCQRSLVFRFPDYITVQAISQPGGAALAIYSRSVYGYDDMGVNQKRIQRWLTLTDAALAKLTPVD